MTLRSVTPGLTLLCGCSMLVEQSVEGMKVNGTPSVSAVQIEPAEAFTTDDLIATAVDPRDPEGHRVDLRWQWFEDGTSIEGVTTERLPAARTRKNRTYRVRVVPSDGTTEGIGIEAERRVDNSPPELLDAWIRPSVVRVGDTLECGASVADPDGDPVSMAFSWADGSTDSTTTVPASAVPGDTFACTLTAHDDDHGLASVVIEAMVENTPPEVTVQVTPEQGPVGQQVFCEATATDIDGDEPQVTYRWSNGVSGSSFVVSPDDEPGQPVTCTATATDAAGATAVGTADFTVVNTDPVLSAVVVTPDPPTNDQVLTCAASATDVDGDTPLLIYSWEHVETGRSLGTSDTLDLTRTVVRPYEHVECTVTAEDPHGGVAVGSAAVSPTNRAPTVAVSFMPASDVTVEDTLECIATQGDPDRDPLTTTFVWTVDGVVVPATGSSTLTSELAGAFAKHQEVGCAVTVDDGLGGTATDSIATDIVNSPPVLSAVSMRPNPMYTDELVQATGTAFDADGESFDMTFDWTVNGTLVQSGSNEYLDGQTWFSRGDTLGVTITVSDSEATVTGSASFVVSNSIPTAPSLAIYPRWPHVGDSLLCVVETASVDADGDPINYTMSWTVDGRRYNAGGHADSGMLDSGDPGWVGPSTTTWTDDTVSGDDLGEGERWNCTATPDDGTDVGVPVSTSVVIETSTP